MTQNLLDDICIVTALKGMALSDNEAAIRTEAYSRICAHGYDLVNRESLARRRQQAKDQLSAIELQIAALNETDTNKTHEI